MYDDWMLIAATSDFVLSKRVCRSCKNLLWRTDMWRAGANWAYYDDEAWHRRGVVTCPFHRKGGTFIAETRAIYILPPETCPYKLEQQVVANNITKAIHYIGGNDKTNGAPVALCRPSIKVEFNENVTLYIKQVTCNN